MKPDNVAKRLWAFFIVLTMCITVQPVVPVKAQEAVQTAARTIYTEFKDGNSTHSGDGSYGNPYNLFEDAYAAAGNGDEISILGSGAFLNAEAAEPFIFDKSVTVNGNGNTFSNYFVYTSHFYKLFLSKKLLYAIIIRQVLVS